MSFVERKYLFIVTDVLTSGPMAAVFTSLLRCYPLVVCLRMAITVPFGLKCFATAFDFALELLFGRMYGPVILQRLLYFVGSATSGPLAYVRLHMRVIGGLVFAQNRHFREPFATVLEFADIVLRHFVQTFRFGLHFYVVLRFLMISQKLFNTETPLTDVALEWLLFGVRAPHVCHQIVFFGELAVTSVPIAEVFVVINDFPLPAATLRIVCRSGAGAASPGSRYLCFSALWFEIFVRRLVVVIDRHNVIVTEEAIVFG